MDKTLLRLLQRFSRGECPRVSRRQFEELEALRGLGQYLQRESAHGADTRSGYILVPLRNQADVSGVREWLKERGLTGDSNG